MNNIIKIRKNLYIFLLLNLFISLVLINFYKIVNNKYNYNIIIDKQGNYYIYNNSEIENLKNNKNIEIYKLKYIIDKNKTKFYLKDNIISATKKKLNKFFILLIIIIIVFTFIPFCMSCEYIERDNKIALLIYSIITTLIINSWVLYKTEKKLPLTLKNINELKYYNKELYFKILKKADYNENLAKNINIDKVYIVINPDDSSYKLVFPSSKIIN